MNLYVQHGQTDFARLLTQGIWQASLWDGGTGNLTVRMRMTCIVEEGEDMNANFAWTKGRREYVEFAVSEVGDVRNVWGAGGPGDWRQDAGDVGDARQ